VAGIVELFESGGGVFLTPAERIRETLVGINALVFDWDGVFNDGSKGEGAPSSFSELDSMGTNLLRFGWWLRNEGRLPLVAIVTGQDNPTARILAARERFQAVYSGFLDKGLALDHLESHFGIEPERVAYCFDDVLDLSVADRCGLRFLVRSAGSPLLLDYVRDEGLADYVTASRGGQGAVREVSELLLGLEGLYGQVVGERSAHTDLYATYLAQRNANESRVFRSCPGGEGVEQD
jgi:3-deoxy-D-manno-octulosonate 8-phosphate phosphatase (KDO 8-P phosphatase)